MFGDPLERIRHPLRWTLENSLVVSFDGNDNKVAKIKKTRLKNFQVFYATPSVRLSAGPNSEFRSVGTYQSLSDAKQIVELLEKSEAFPVFVPGKLIAWTNQERTIKRANEESVLERLRRKMYALFRKIVSCVTRLSAGFRLFLNKKESKCIENEKKD